MGRRYKQFTENTYSHPSVSAGPATDTKIHGCPSSIAGPLYLEICMSGFNLPWIINIVCYPWLVESADVEPMGREG